MLMAIIILTVAIMEAKKEHERILEKLERIERIEQKKERGGPHVGSSFFRENYKPYYDR